MVLLVVDDWNEMDMPESREPTLPRRWYRSTGS
jgi:hypothetical protein